jgi:hypothetical protein
MFQHGLMPYSAPPTPSLNMTFENLRDRKDKKVRIWLERQEERNKLMEEKNTWLQGQSVR